MPDSSYRGSHLQKGAEYRHSFSSQPHLAMTWRLERKLLSRIVRERYPNGVATHLDFACGTGRILGFLSPSTRSSTGVDLSASMLQVARETLPGVEIIEADLTRDDHLGCREFDLITAFRFFPNAEPDLRRDALAAIARHLKPSGILIFNNHRNRNSLTRRMVVAKGRVTRAPRANADWGMTREEAYELIQEGGMEVEREYALSVLPLSDRHMLRPTGVTETVEALLTRIALFTPLAQNLIYVCRKVDTGS